MGLFDRNKRTGGFMDEIRCDESSYLIWKWHPSGVQLGEGNRENSIRWGSSLRVKDGEVAVFVYKQKDGTMQDFIVGPYDQIIKTANFPVLASIVGLAYEGGTPFQAEVYFINLAQIIQVKFGVPLFPSHKTYPSGIFELKTEHSIITPGGIELFETEIFMSLSKYVPAVFKIISLSLLSRERFQFESVLVN